jgi:ribosomal-protein-alanine N-acetyltransferase
MDLSLALDITAANQVLEFFQDYEVRPAGLKDLDKISTIENVTSDYPCTNQQLQDYIDKTLVFVGGNDILGFAVIVTVENQAELHNIAIVPQQQGNGLGSLFLKALVAALPMLVEQFYLEVRVSNFRAIRLYQRMGFSKIAERKDYYRNGLGREDAVIMAKACNL